MRDPLAKMPAEIDTLWDLVADYPVVGWTIPAARRMRIEGLISPHTAEHIRQARAVIERITETDGWTYAEKPLAPGWLEIRATGPYGSKGVTVELAAFVPVERPVMAPPPPLPLEDRPVEVSPLASLTGIGDDGPPTRDDLEAIA